MLFILYKMHNYIRRHDRLGIVRRFGFTVRCKRFTNIYPFKNSCRPDITIMIDWT